MFYSNELLQKRSKLSHVWQAAHGRRLGKASILKLNISESCNSIISPSVPHSLRLQAVLTSGVVTIFSNQCQYLKGDAENAVKKLSEKEQCFNGAGSINLPKRKAEKKEETTMELIQDFEPVDLFFNHSNSSASQAIWNDSEFFVVPYTENERLYSLGRAEVGTEDYFEDRDLVLDAPNMPESLFQEFKEFSSINERNLHCSFTGCLKDNEIIKETKKRKHRPTLDEFIFDAATIMADSEGRKATKNHIPGFKWNITASGIPVSSFASLWNMHLKKKRGRKSDLGNQQSLKHLQMEAVDYPIFPNSTEKGNSSHKAEYNGVEVEKLRESLHLGSPTKGNQSIFQYNTSSRSQTSHGDSALEGISAEVKSFPSSEPPDFKRRRISDVIQALGMKDNIELPSLLETGPSQLMEPSAITKETLEVLWRARILVNSNTISLNDIIPHLTRGEAAKVFHHVLVATSKGFVSVQQDTPYGDVIIQWLL